MSTSDKHGGPCQNTDRELWRERDGDYYADSIHVTEGGGIGINCGGMVYVRPIREWHRLAQEAVNAAASAEQPPEEPWDGRAKRIIDALIASRSSARSQEPVAWMVFHESGENDYSVYADKAPAEHVAGSHNTEAIPLYRAVAPNSATSAHVALTGVAGAKYCPHGFDTRLECGACLRARSEGRDA